MDFGRVRGVALALALLSGPLLAGGLGGDAAAQQQARPRLVGKLPVINPPDRYTNNVLYGAGDNNLVVNDARGRVYMVFNLYPSQIQKPLFHIQAFDLDTLKPLGIGRVRPAGVSNISVHRYGSDFLYALDQERGRLFAAVQYQAPGPTGPDVVNGILAIDLDKVDRGQSHPGVLIRGPAVADPDTTLVGLAFDPTRGEQGKLIVQYDAGNDRVKTATLVQWDVKKALAAPNGGFDADWGTLNNLRGCNFRLANGGPLLRTQDAVVGVCSMTGSTVSLGGNPVPVVFKMTSPERADARVDTFVGPTSSYQKVMVDTEGQRLHIAVYDGGLLVWGFDARSERFVGIAGLGFSTNQWSLGIDEANGRLYGLLPNQQPTGGAAVIPGGLYSIDGRLLPVPQPLRYPEFHGVTGGMSVKVARARPGRPARVFARRAFAEENDGRYTCDPNVNPSQCDLGGVNHEMEYPGTGRRKMVEDEPYWLVIEDPVPTPKQAVPDDLDRLTVNVREQSGLTEASYEGTSSAYGFKARFVGGIPPYREEQCVRDDREMRFGVVPESRLTPYETTARAAGFSLNEALAADLERPVDRCFRQGAASSIPQERRDQIDQLLAGFTKDARAAKPTECTDDQTAEWKPTPILSAVPGLPGKGTAKVTCQARDEAVQAEAATSWDMTYQGNDYDTLQIAKAEVTTSIIRRMNEGVVVTARAAARGIDIPLGPGSAEFQRRAGSGDNRVRFDSIHISTARSESVVWSNGRPAAGARSTLRRALCGVSGPGLPEGPGSCATDDAQLRAMVDRINQVLTESRSQWRAYFPDPDPDLARGSRLGYVAGIQKSIPDRLDDQLVNGDFSFEVPAFELRRIGDDTTGRRRQIYSFAGVRTTATYGINALVSSSGEDERPLPADFGGDGGLTDVLSHVTSAPLAGPALVGRQPARPLVAVQGPGARIFGLLTRPVKESGLAGSVWLLLSLPFFLAWRRGSLVRASR